MGDAHQKLARSILTRALRDVLEGGIPGRKARWFLLKDQKDFPFWCHAAGVHPTQVRRTVKEALRMFEGN